MLPRNACSRDGSFLVAHFEDVNFRIHPNISVKMVYEGFHDFNLQIYSFKLPCHRGIDGIRTFLKYLGTSRDEQLDNFWSRYNNNDKELKELHTLVISRATDAV